MKNIYHEKGTKLVSLTKEEHEKTTSNRPLKNYSTYELLQELLKRESDRDEI